MFKFNIYQSFFYGSLISLIIATITFSMMIEPETVVNTEETFRLCDLPHIYETFWICKL